MKHHKQDGLAKIKSLSDISEYFLQLKPDSPIDYQKITDTLLELSGAKYTAFNIYDDHTPTFRTIAVSGDLKSIQTVFNFLNLDITKKYWTYDQSLGDRIDSQTTTRFKDFLEFVGSILPNPIARTIQTTFGLGEIILVRIIVKNEMIGDFVILMDKETIFDAEEIVEIYSRQVGMVVTNKRTHEELKEVETNFKALFENGPIGVAYHKMIYDEQGKAIDFLYLDANKTYKELTGINPIGLRGTQAFPGLENDPFDWIGMFASVAETGQQQRFQQFLQSNQRWYDCVAYQYKPKHFVAAFFEITEKKAVEKTLEISESLHKEIISNISDGILIIDQDKLVIYQSANCEKIFGWTASDLLGKQYTNFIFKDDVEMIRKQFYSMIIDGVKITTFECRVKDKNGIYRTVEITATNGFDNPSIKGILVTFHDISARKAIENELAESEEKYRLITENVSDVIAILNITQEKTTFVSPSIYQQRGYTIEEALQQTLESSMSLASWEQTKNLIDAHTRYFLEHPKGNHVFRSEIQQYHKEGHLIWIEISARYQFNKNQEIEILIVSRNIDERKKAELERTYFSFHDHLTGIYNRRYFEEELIRLDTERNLPLAIIMGDVNGLKLINDSFGHQSGDELLIRAASVVKKQLRGDEIFARLGGDEFAILLPGTDQKTTQNIIKRINDHTILEKVAHMNLSISFGFDIKENKSQVISDVLKRAEDDMYRTKMHEKRHPRFKTIDVILNALYEKGGYERSHSEHVSLLCEKMAIAMGFNQEETNRLKIAGFVHDIGKIRLAEHILNKTGRFSEEELFEIMKHPEDGWRILNSVVEYRDIAEFVMAHHERYDGTGYPHGLKGEAIPVEARIIAIAEAFDAMISRQGDQESQRIEDTKAELMKVAGTQFDPELVSIFIANL